MADKKATVNQSRTVNETKKSNKNSKVEKGFLLSIDDAIAKHHRWLIWAFMAITLLFSLLLYDPKVSLSGDDSSYITRAADFIRSFKYPAFQGPLYPMVLGVVVAIFGISLTPLKLVSLISMLAAIYLFYKLLKERIPASILVITTALISINSYFLYYASQTYSEAFFFLVEVVLITVFFRKFIDHQEPLDLKSDLLRHLLLAACLLALTLTRSIGYSAIMAIAAYFVLKGQWKNLLYFLLAFAAVFMVFQGLKFALWHEGGMQFSTQGGSLMNKDYYNPQDGKEDVAGLLKRFMGNSHLYFSKHLMYMLGFREFALTLPIQPVLTLLVFLLSLTTIALTYKKNNYIFFLGLLAGAFLAVTFVVLQVKWDQSRLIIPAFPFLIMLLVSVFYYVAQFKKTRAVIAILPILVLISFFQTLGASATQIKEARKESGRFGGLTPDWKHYLQASEWAADNLPKNAVIACRKPSISFIYGKGREFYGIMQMPTYNVEHFREEWKKNGSQWLVYKYTDFTGKELAPYLFRNLKQNIMAQLVVGETFYFVDILPDSIRSKTINELASIGIRAITSPDSLNMTPKDEKSKTSLIYPDSLLNTLVKSKVSHVITANLRRNSLEKNGQIINTVERYMAFIEDKYPGFMTKVIQVGEDGDEPAIVNQLNYEKAGLNPLP